MKLSFVTGRDMVPPELWELAKGVCPEFDPVMLFVDSNLVITIEQDDDAEPLPCEVYQ